ncbi:hypothetical protein BH23THE1_BH23THE1_34010 [soil metagenome]
MALIDNTSNNSQVIESLTARIKVGIDKFFNYWILRTGTKTLDNVFDLHRNWTMIMHALSNIREIDNVKLVKSMYYLHKYEDRLISVLTIPQGQNVNKQEYIETKADTIDAWNKMAKIFSWAKFKSKFPESAELTERIYKQLNAYL